LYLLGPETMASPAYSLLLPVRNEARRVEEVAAGIRSELAGASGGWEVLFADDASDDGTREKLAALAPSHGFRLLAPPANLGRGAARNLLAREARGAFLVFLDGDCVPLPGCLRAWEGLDPRAAWLGRVEYERAPASGLSRFLGEGSGAAKLRDPSAVPPAYFVSQHFGIAREAFLAAGGFRTDLSGWGGEDTDFGYRLEERGTPLRSRRQAAARHPSVTGIGAYLGQVRAFGRANLPVLVRERPALERRFKLHLARFPWSLLFLNPALDRACRALAAGFPGVPWPHAVYRYAIFNSYARGFRESGALPPRAP
jgi:glycosyltransferase involved in cell wall biosynthesis